MSEIGCQACGVLYDKGGPDAHRCPASDLHLIDWATFWTVDHKAEDWLLGPVLPRGRSVATYSPAKTGKSLLALYVAACLAMGKACFDRPMGNPCHVLYLDAEMTETDVWERLDDMGFGPDTDLRHLHYALLPSLPPLDTAEGGQALLGAVGQLHAELVVIDTTARVLSGAENDADTLRDFHMYTGTALKAAGVTVWRLDHPGKDLTKGMRGTSAKTADVDLVWEMTPRSEGGLKLRATHRRQGWIPEVVDLLQLDDPALRYVLATETWPTGTVEVARQLDELSIPIDWGGKRVKKALAGSPIRARWEVVAAAIRYRKRSGTPSGTPSLRPLGTPDGNTQEGRYGNTLGNTPEHPSAGIEGGSPSLDGNTLAPACWQCGAPATTTDATDRPVCDQHRQENIA